MSVMPVRFCPHCNANRHVTSFIAESEWCAPCREEVARRLPSGGAGPSATDILSKLLRNQRDGNPALADKQERLISALRAEHGSDEKVVERLAGLFGMTHGRTDTEIDSDDEPGEEDLEPELDDADDACPMCGSHDECQHLFAYVDVTFGEIVGGYCAERLGVFASLITAAFRRRQELEIRPDASWADDQIEALWVEATACIDGRDDPIEVDHGHLRSEATV